MPLPLLFLQFACVMRPLFIPELSHQDNPPRNAQRPILEVRRDQHQLVNFLSLGNEAPPYSIVEASLVFLLTFSLFNIRRASLEVESQLLTFPLSYAPPSHL